MKRTRKLKPETVRTMAMRRALSIYRAWRGGWIVYDMDNRALYATHSWPMVKRFLKTRPVKS